MKTADEMFEELGYEIYFDDKNTLMYKKINNLDEISITFDKRDFIRGVYAIEKTWVANNYAIGITQDFKNEFEKYCSANGYWTTIRHTFTLEELQVINKKVEELGWLDDNRRIEI